MSSFLKGAKRYGTPLLMRIIILTLPRGMVQRPLVVICYLADSSLTGYMIYQIKQPRVLQYFTPVPKKLLYLLQAMEMYSVFLMTRLWQFTFTGKWHATEWVNIHIFSSFKQHKLSHKLIAKEECCPYSICDYVQHTVAILTHNNHSEIDNLVQICT